MPASADITAFSHAGGVQLRYNYRLYPTPGQQQALARAFGCARVVFNDALRARRQAHEAGLPYLTDAELSARLARAIASDTCAVEVWPPAWGDESAPFGFLHRVLIGQFGMALGELWHLDDLAADCDQDGVCEFFLASAPLNVRGGIGSPPNALALK
jgi:hypothetical protein